MKLPIRSFATRVTAVALLSGAAATAFAPTASAAERRPIDQMADVVAQLIYPDAQGGVNDWTAEERIDGWLGYNSFPGGPFGHWGPGPEAVGYYGMVGAVIGGPPLASSPHPVGGQRSRIAESVAAVGDLPAGPSKHFAEPEKLAMAHFSPSRPAALSTSADASEATADDPLADLLADVAGLLLGSDEEEQQWTTGNEPESFPVDQTQSEDPPRK